MTGVRRRRPGSQQFLQHLDRTTYPQQGLPQLGPVRIHLSISVAAVIESVF